MKSRFPRLARYTVAAAVAALAFNCASRAVQTTVVPNAVYRDFDLADGAYSPLFAIPVTDSPVALQAVTTTVGDRGAAQATVLRTGVAPLFLAWVGINSYPSASLTGGSSAGTSIIMLTIDQAHSVFIQVADPASIRVFNSSSIRQTGRITLTW